MNNGEKLNQSSDSVNKPRNILRISLNAFICSRFGANSFFSRPIMLKWDLHDIELPIAIVRFMTRICLIRQLCLTD